MASMMMRLLTYLAWIKKDSLVEEFEHFLHEREELGVSVRVLHAERRLRIRLDQAGPQLLQVIKSV